MPGVPQPDLLGGRGVDVAHDQFLDKLPPACDELAVLVDHEAVAVEDELVLSAYQVAEDHIGEVVTGALDEHSLAFRALLDVIRRRGDVDDHLGSGEGLIGGRRSRLPDVLADREPDGRSVDTEHGSGIAHLKVALLVEHPIVG
jgi:hypothetical protein